MLIDAGGYEIYDLKGKKISEVKAGDANASSDLTGRDSMTDAHFANFIAAIRKGEKLNLLSPSAMFRHHNCNFQTCMGSEP